MTNEKDGVVAERVVMQAKELRFPSSLTRQDRQLISAITEALTTVRKEARAAVFKEVSQIINAAGEEWGDQARARKSKTYSAYVFAALDLKGRVDEAAANGAGANQ